MFAAVIDWVLSDLQSERGPRHVPVFEGLSLGEIAFVDDLIAWEGTRRDLVVQAQRLIVALRRWGLKVNHQKSQLYVSPYNKEKEEVVIDGGKLEPDDHLQVMGLSFKVGISPKEALMPLFAKAKSKYWALKHLFRAKVPLAGRLKLLHRIVGNTVLWCSSAFQPDKQALQAVNVLQSQMVIWSMRMAKRDGEDWVEFRMRSFRSARWAIQRFIGIRWSTCWLQRSWDYAGHRARSASWVPPPPSGVFDSFRTLDGGHMNKSGNKASVIQLVFSQVDAGRKRAQRCSWWIVEGWFLLRTGKSGKVGGRSGWNKELPHATRD